MTKKDTTIENQREFERHSLHSSTVLIGYQRPGFHACWVNDVPESNHRSGSNIGKYLDAGYTYCKATEYHKSQRINFSGEDKPKVDGDHISQLVDRRNGIFAFLLEIPNEFYEADQKELAKEAQRKLDAMRSPAELLDSEYARRVHRDNTKTDIAR
jgi:hypothetical protein